LAVGDEGLCHLMVDLLRSPLGGGDKAVQPCQWQQETDQAHAASADLNVDQVEGQNQSMQKGESRATLKELGHLRTDIEGVMPGVPRLQGKPRQNFRYVYGLVSRP
jgi:hypothetical protein